MRSDRLSAIVGVLIAMLFCSAGTSAAQGNAVTAWNSVATAAVLINPGRILDSRALAGVQTAVHDTVNAIDHRYQPYLCHDNAPGASVDAAVAAAAHDVLVKWSTASNVEPAYLAALAAIPDGQAKADGIAVGQRCAIVVNKRLDTDGADAASQPVYVSTGQPGDYDRTPFNAPTPPGVVGLFPGWGRVQPWAIDVADHQVRGPDPLDSIQYAFDVQYLKAIGSMDSLKSKGFNPNSMVLLPKWNDLAGH